MLRPTFSPPCPLCRDPSGAHDQMFIIVGQLRVSRFGAPSLTRGLVSSLQLLLNSSSQLFSSLSSAGIMALFFCLKFETSPTLQNIEVEVTLRLTVSQPVCQGVEPSLGLVPRYYFLSECRCLKVAVLSLCGALSDERFGLFLSFSVCSNLSVLTSRIYVSCVLQFSKVYVEVKVTLRLTVGRSVSQSVSQSVSMSWYRAPLWDLRPDITFCRNVSV
jgi:hypothetical protein